MDAGKGDEHDDDVKSNVSEPSATRPRNARAERQDFRRDDSFDVGAPRKFEFTIAERSPVAARRGNGLSPLRHRNLALAMKRVHDIGDRLSMDSNRGR